MKTSTSKVGRGLLATAFFASLVSGCGLAPTGIGHDREGDEPSDAQLAALAELVEVNAVVFQSGSRDLCFSFESGFYYEAPRPSYQFACTVYERAEGASNELKADGCRLSFITQTFSERTILLECAQNGQEPCLGEGPELGRLTTAADFVGIRETTQDTDGLKLTDTTNAGVSATLHNSFGYCESNLSESDEEPTE